MARTRKGRLALLLCSVGMVSACADGSDFKLFQGSGADADAEVSSLDTSATGGSVKLVERDVEAPEVFSETDAGLWDGRPSLGGVWVAHPDVTDPERVIIRNEANGKFVIGALFKRERENPGPKIQVSSDAAAALGLLAGAPSTLNVTALRRQEVPIAGETPAGDGPAPDAETLPAPGEIETASLGPLEGAGAALDKIEADAPPQVETAAVTPPPKPAPAPVASRLSKPFVQIGLFSVATNAENAAASLRTAGVLPNIVEDSSNGKPYYRVTVGPATNSADRAAILKKVKGLGYSDAYFVTN